VSNIGYELIEKFGTDGIDPDRLHDAQYEMYSVAQELIRLADKASDVLKSEPGEKGGLPSWSVRHARCAGLLDHVEWYLRQLAERLDKEAK
jgi:hypothetical protein